METSIHDALKWRYATKKFDPVKEVPADKMDLLMESLQMAPSSFGLQLWEFVVIPRGQQDLRKKLHPHCWNQNQILDCSQLVVMTTPTKVTKSHLNSMRELMKQQGQVPGEQIENYMGMVEGFIGNMKESEQLTWMQKQSYLALGFLLLTAAQLGIDTCPLEGFVSSEVDKVLGLDSKHLKSAVLCAVGYRADDDKYAFRPKMRYELDKIVTQI